MQKTISSIILGFVACTCLSMSSRAASQNKYDVQHIFTGGADGAFPRAALSAHDGVLYGTTYAGGGSGCKDAFLKGCGTVFSLIPDGQETVLHVFLPKIDDGNVPQASVFLSGDSLYGTTEYGGRHKVGSVFRMTLDGAEKRIYSLRGLAGGQTDPANPIAPITKVSSTIYGTTYDGGAQNLGTVFAIAPDGKTRVVHSFAGGSDGAHPSSGLTNIDGTLYGTTSAGGGAAVYCSQTPGCGTVFSITPTGVETILYSFQLANSTDGAQPSGGLLQAKNVLYGTTIGGGNFGHGTAYSLTLAGQQTQIYSFQGPYEGVLDGSSPNGEMVMVKNTLYGTTSEGGAHNGGSLFSLTITGTETVLHSFGSGPTDGSMPLAGLTAIGDTLFGTTYFGGDSKCLTASGCGTLFSFTR